MTTTTHGFIVPDEYLRFIIGSDPHHMVSINGYKMWTSMMKDKVDHNRFVAFFEVTEDVKHPLTDWLLENNIDIADCEKFAHYSLKSKSFHDRHHC